MLRILSGVLLWGLSMPAFAGHITAELDHNEGPVDDEFTLTITLEGEVSGDFQMPEVEGLVFGDPSHSQRMSIINGQRTSEEALMFQVRAQKTGDFTISSMSAVLDGKKESTLPLTLRVRKVGSASNAQNGGGGGGNSGSNAKATEDTGGVFIERECDNSSPYVGQQVMCAIRIYHRGNMNGASRPGSSSADFRRFTVEGEHRYQKLVNGQRYIVVELHEVVVPNKAGKMDLPPFALEARILTWSKRGNPLNRFFDKFGGGVFNFDMNFSEEKQVTVKSDPTPLDVKPLPEAGKPAGFSGLVGSFNMTANLSKTPVATGDTSTATVTLSGEGLLDTVDSPKLNLEGIGKVYPDKPEYKESITAETGVSSSKIFRFAVVPDKAGTYNLGKVEVPAFNPKLGQYVTLEADLGALTVEQGNAKEQPLAVGQNAPISNEKAPVETIGSDLLSPHAASLMKQKQTITSSFVIGITTLSMSPWIFSLGFMGLQRRRRLLAENSGEVRRSKAFKIYRSEMDQARKHLEHGNTDDAMIAAHRAFRELVGAKANKHGAALAARELDGQLAGLGATDSIRAEAKRVLSLLDQAEFGGRKLANDAVKALLQDLDGVAHAMETIC